MAAPCCSLLLPGCSLALLACSCLLPACSWLLLAASESVGGNIVREKAYVTEKRVKDSPQVKKKVNAPGLGDSEGARAL